MTNLTGVLYFINLLSALLSFCKNLFITYAIIHSLVNRILAE